MRRRRRAPTAPLLRRRVPQRATPARAAAGPMAATAAASTSPRPPLAACRPGPSRPWNACCASWRRRRQRRTLPMAGGGSRGVGRPRCRPRRRVVVAGVSRREHGRGPVSVPVCPCATRWRPAAPGARSCVQCPSNHTGRRGAVRRPHPRNKRRAAGQGGARGSAGVGGAAARAPRHAHPFIHHTSRPPAWWSPAARGSEGSGAAQASRHW